MFIVLVGVIIFWLWYRSHDYKVRVREVTSSGVRLIYDTPAKIKTDDERVEYLGLMSRKKGHKSLPLPPPEAIDYDPNKKKKVVEAWYGEETGYVYIKDGEEIQGFQPLTTKQRQMLVHQIVKKEERKSQGWQQNIPLIVGSIAIVAILAILLIFWGEAVQPMVDFGGQMGTVTANLKEVAEQLAATASDRQIISTPP